MNKTLLLVSTLVLAISSLVTTSVWADSHEKADADCITQVAYAAMSDDEKADANEADMLCIGDEGEDQSQDDETVSENATAKEATEAEDEPEVDESQMNCLSENEFIAMSDEEKELRSDDRCVGSE